MKKIKSLFEIKKYYIKDFCIKSDSLKKNNLKNLCLIFVKFKLIYLSIEINYI